MPDRPPPFPLLTAPNGIKTFRWGDPRLASRSSATSAAPVELVRDLELTRGVIVAATPPDGERAAAGINVQLALELPPAAGPAASSPSATACGCDWSLRAPTAGNRSPRGRGRTDTARRAGHARLGFADHSNSKEDRTAVLRIDETSGTLVAPQASGLVGEPARPRGAARPRDRLVGRLRRRARPDAACACSSREPVPYVDLLGLDEERNRVVVILVTGDTVEWQLGRALGAAADVASWDRERLLSVDTELEAVDGKESPALVLVAGGYDPRALATIDWLASRHDVPVYAYTVAMVRFGGERLLSVRREPAEIRPRRTRSTCCCSGATPRPRRRRTSTPRRPPARLAEEQAEHAPELVGAPGDRGPARIRTTSCPRGSPARATCRHGGAVGLRHGQPETGTEHRAQQRRAGLGSRRGSGARARAA